MRDCCDRNLVGRLFKKEDKFSIYILIFLLFPSKAITTFISICYLIRQQLQPLKPSQLNLNSVIANTARTSNQKLAKFRASQDSCIAQ